MATISVYTFEDADGNEQEYSTQNSIEAKEYASKYNLRVVDNEYEWSDSSLVAEWDFTEKPEALAAEAERKRHDGLRAEAERLATDPAYLAEVAAVHDD